MANGSQSIFDYCQREYPLAAHWQDTLPSLWQLQTDFSLKVIQCRDPFARPTERTFILGHETRCHNGVHTIHSFVYLSPAFPTLSQLEQFTRDNAVEILHAHFYGSHDNGCSEISIAG